MARDEDKAALRRALSQPIAALTAVQVGSQEQARALIDECTENLTGRPTATLDLSAEAGHAVALIEKAKAATTSWTEGEGVLFLVDESRFDAEDAPGFWRTLNLQREQWAHLGAHVVFLLRPASYRLLLTTADHLASWMPLKFDVRPKDESGVPLQQGMVNLSTESDDMPSARLKLELLEADLNEYLARPDQDPGTLLQRFYIPMTQAAIDVGEMGGANDVLRRSIEYAERALSAAQELGKQREESIALGNQGLAYYFLGETRRAIEYFEQDLAITGDRRGEGSTLGNLGVAYASLGEVRRAIECYQQNLGILRELGDRRDEGTTLGNLGVAYEGLGEVRRAMECYEQSLSIARETGNQRGEGTTLCNLGNAYLPLGEAHRSIEYYEQSLEISRELGDRRNEGTTLGNLGVAYTDLGETRRAVEFFEHSLRVAREIDDRQGAGILLHNGAGALAKEGRLVEAVAWEEEAVRIFEVIESPHVENARADLAELRAKLRA